MAEQPKSTPANFVYVGQRLLEGHKLGTAILLVNPDGSLETTAKIYQTRGKRRMILGGVYSGASFTAEDKAVGLSAASYTEKWPDRDMLVTWTAKEKAAECMVAEERFRKDAIKQNVIEECMAPLRKIYVGMIERGDVASARALRIAVDLALMRKGGM